MLVRFLAQCLLWPKGDLLGPKMGLPEAIEKLVNFAK